MKYYIDENNQLYAYDDDTCESDIKSGLTELSDAEAKSIIDKKMNERNKLSDFITKRQTMLQLNKIGLYESVMNFINKPEQIELKIDFDYSEIFYRNSLFIVAISNQFNLDDAAIDNLFFEASKLL